MLILLPNGGRIYEHSHVAVYTLSFSQWAKFAHKLFQLQSSKMKSIGEQQVELDLVHSLNLPVLPLPSQSSPCLPLTSKALSLKAFLPHCRKGLTMNTIESWVAHPLTVMVTWLLSHTSFVLWVCVDMTSPWSVWLDQRHCRLITHILAIRKQLCVNGPGLYTRLGVRENLCC